MTTLIVGAGVIGLSTARVLAQRGEDVVVLERHVIGSGATGRSSGVIRCHYGVPSLAAMAWQSLPVLAGAAEILGADGGYHRTGYLVGVGPENVEALTANVAMQRALGIEVELVGHADAGRMWPSARLDDFAAFAYEPCGGYGDGHQTALAFATAARRHGTRLRQHCPVASLSEAGGRITGVVLADGERVPADRVVVAAGPWSVALAAGVGIDLPVRPQRARILLIDPGGTGPGPVPVFSDLVSLQYVRAEGRASLLAGDSDHTEPEWGEDPDDLLVPADEGQLLQAVAKFDHRFPRLDRASLQSTYCGYYDVSPDYNPVISAAPIEGLWLCAGFSGHGYKISPAVGELAADLVLYGSSQAPNVDERDFRLARFEEGDLLISTHPYVGAGQMR